MRTGTAGSLTAVNIQGTKIGDTELKPLQVLTDLTFLNLNNAWVTDGGLAQLKGLTSLRALYVGSKTTDLGLGHLQGLTNLESLGVYGTQVTDAGLVHLKGLTKLKSLGLYNGLRSMRRQEADA